MCNMLVFDEKSDEELKFIIYNVVFSESSGKFTTDSIYRQLQEYKIKTERFKLERLFREWSETGLIFENAKEYVINLATI